jgi:ABC-type polysaccharide/polyol phosphate export permease
LAHASNFYLEGCLAFLDNETVLRKFAAKRNLLKNLVLRDLKNRYIGSVGGFLWSVIHPIVLLSVYTFVFRVVFDQDVRPEFGNASYPLFLFCGLLPWLLFSDTILRSCSAITDNSSLITKTTIPAEILPVSITISNLVNHLIGLAILFMALAVFHTIPLSSFWILIYMPMLLMFAQGLGWIVAGLQVFFRDTMQLLQILMLFWFWFTPVFWASGQASDPKIAFLLDLNPIAVLVTGYRNSLLHVPQPGPLHIAMALGSSLLVFLIGAFVFKRAKPVFADVL